MRCETVIMVYVCHPTTDRIPSGNTAEDEKQFVRTTAMTVLFQDPSDRVATQSGLLITNMARFDVPRPWGSLLPELASAAAMESPILVGAKSRALTALKYVLRALRSKRFIIERPPGITMGFGDGKLTIALVRLQCPRPSLAEQHPPLSLHADLEALSNQIDEDRRAMVRMSKELLSAIRSQWEGNFTALLQRSPGWEARAALAVAGLAALRELLLLLPDLKDIEQEFNAMLQEGAQAAGMVAGPLFANQANGAAAAVSVESDPYVTALSKCWERLLQVALVAMDRHTIAFAAHVPAWVSLCINTALLGMDAAAVHGIRAKSRVLLTRFVARAMLQPLYRKDSGNGDFDVAYLLPLPIVRQRAAASTPELQAAGQCLDSMLSEEDGKCAALVQAVVSKYIVLAPEELEEWEADPESFARQVDLETSPDADTPRPCGVALLECMLERAEGPVSGALVALASSLQAQHLTAEGVLPREAVYRAVGECFASLRSRVDFRAWYEGELRALLVPNLLPGLLGSVILARAIWLVGVCGEELRPEAWGDAFALVVTHISSPDLVVALMAVSAATAMVGTVLEEEQFTSQPAHQQRTWLESMDTRLAGMGTDDGGDNDVAAQANAEFQAHMSAVEAQVDALMTGCFALLPRLGEAESMVRVLQCVSATVELMGDRVAPHLGSITGALPQVWGVVAARTGEGTGALARLQCSLLAMLAHLIGKLGRVAAEEPKVSAVLLPLLVHATDVTSPQAEPLIDDGLKLWLSVLKATPGPTTELQGLATQRLVPILQRGQDNATALRIAEGYALHGGAAAVAPMLPQIAASIMSTMEAAMAAMQPKPGNRGAANLGALPPDLAQEGGAAVSLLAVLQRVFDPLPTELEHPVRTAALMVATDYGGGATRLPARSIGLMESAVEVIYRLTFRNPAAIGALTGSDLVAQDRLLDRWIALSAMRDVGEMFIPSLGAVGRVRRHNAAVALCSLLLADVCPGLRDYERLARAFALCLNAAREQRMFEVDQQRLADLQPADPAHQDQLLLRRLLLARGDPLRGVDAVDAVRTAAIHVAGWEGKDKFLASLEALDPMYSERMAELLAGQLPESEADAAIRSMQQTALSDVP